MLKIRFCDITQAIFLISQNKFDFVISQIQFYDITKSILWYKELILWIT